jgi:hypothetical protein
MNHFADWLSTTLPSVFIQSHEGWMIPLLQSIHIIGIGLAVGSTLMMTLRLLGWIATDQSVLENQRRFGPWLTAALLLQLATGGLLVIAEPVRELITFSFWLKMLLVLILACLALAFQRSVALQSARWQHSSSTGSSVRLLAWLSFLLLGCIILLGRLIAYDHIWGHLSPATKA